MNLRTTLLVPLVIAAAACGRQDAAPFVAPDPAELARGTATIKMVVVRDSALSRTAPRYAPAAAARVNLYRADAPTGSVVKTGVTTATGELQFSGIAPGDYVLKPVIRSKSTTLVPAAGIPIRVAAGSVVTIDTIRIRLSFRVFGVMATEWFDQVTLRRLRHGGVKILVDSETVASSNVWIKVDSITTDAIGNFEYFRAPGPERLRLRFNSNDITNFKDSTTFQGAGPIPYVKKEETFIVSPVTPGLDRDMGLTAAANARLAFFYPTRITGFLYRDKNNNSFRDSTLATSTKEGLVAGDSITIQLLDSTGTHVIASTARFIAATTTAFTAAGPTYTFNSVAPGKYVIRMDRLASRFGSNPLEFFQGPVYTVIVPELPAASTAPITVQQNFGLVTGQ